MNCPHCDHSTPRTLQTVQSRTATVRARECPHCKCRFTTREKLDEIQRYGCPPASMPVQGCIGLDTPVSPVSSESGSVSVLAPDLLSASVSSKKVNVMEGEKTLHAWALDMFSQCWREVYGVAYVTTPRDRSQLGRMLATLDSDGIPRGSLPGLFRAYVNDPDRFLVEKLRHPLWHFCTDGGLNKYRAQQRPQMSEKETRSHAGVAAFLAMDVKGARNGRK